MIRGKIRNKEYAKQLNDFSKMDLGTITPTDVDMLIEYKNKLYIFGEGKHVMADEMPRGQELALTRLCTDLQYRKPSLLIYFEHSFLPDVEVDVSGCRVKRYYYKNKWFCSF